MTLLDQLQEAGLTKREAHIYLALLRKKEFVASEISSIVPVGRTKIYEIIPTLVSKGLCGESIKNGKKFYRAIEPKIALQNILNHFQNEFDEIFNKKKKLIKILEGNLIKIYTDNATKLENIDYIELLNDRNQIKNRWIELQKGIKKELLAFNKAPYTTSHEQNIPYQKKISKRKAISKGIYELAEISSDTSLSEFIENIQTYVKLGEECRVIRELPMKMVIIDQKIVMLALIDPVSMEKSITTMIVKHPNFAFAQKHVFESYWEKSVPFADFIKKSTKYLSN